MPIKIERRESSFVAEVSPPEASQPWSTRAPMDFEGLYQQLRDVGCHPIDVADAFIEADPSLRPRFGIDKVHCAECGHDHEAKDVDDVLGDSREMMCRWCVRADYENDPLMDRESQ